MESSHLKLLLTETWIGKLHWDEPLPPLLDRNWREFFTSLVEIDSLKYDRCITPEGAVRLSCLIWLSDGSGVAYGCSIYIRCILNDGSVWCRLLTAKCRAVQLNRISIPRIELNGVMLSKRSLRGSAAYGLFIYFTSWIQKLYCVRSLKCVHISVF